MDTIRIAGGELCRSFYRRAKKNWIRLAATVVLAGILFLAACGSGDAKAEEPIHDNGMGNGAQDEAQSGGQEGKPDGDLAGLEGELTLLSWFPEAEKTWGPTIEAFMKEHPGVTVSIDCPEEQELYFDKYATKIMSGEGYDIVQDADFANSRNGVDLGLFVDLYEYMDSDEEFNKDDYFSCIYGPMETDGKLLRFLRSVSPVYIRMNKRLLERAGVEYTEETISFRELCEIYEKVRESCGEKIFLEEAGYYEPLSVYEGNYYMRNNLMDTDEYEEYLRMNYGMYYETEKREVWSEYGQGIADDVLCRVLGINLQSAGLVNDIFEGTDEMTPAVLYVSSHGERYAVSTNSISISSFSENKELAWEFVKFVVGNYDVDYRDAGFIPPNKERSMAKCEGVEPEIRERLFRDIEAINTVQTIDINLSRNLESVRDDYYFNHTLTAEECRKELANRLYLYMNE